jgi:hypothetical protein
MDFTQNKLTRSEWENLEVPISDGEKQIVQMIIDGYHNINIRFNESRSLFSHIKIPQNPEIEYYLYKKYFEDEVLAILKKYGAASNITAPNTAALSGDLCRLKSADTIRLQNLDSHIKINRALIIEFMLLDLCKDMLKHISKKKQRYAYYLYTLMQLKKSSIPQQNVHILTFVDSVIAYGNSITKVSEIITNAYDFIERNPYLLKYEDKSLFSHQKELFSLVKQETFRPSLILYTAPTGTGKTLSPIGLSEGYRIIFVCVARHIGLALAKAAISLEKKVAFAFGCETASDIRLHYFSAVNFTKHRKSGGIYKVDNSVGDNVEIMICDVQSYLTAMYYMLAFNPAEKIITYWDEPTITMDYEDHPLHPTIRRNWTENKIPTVVLSCATLPSSDEIMPVFDDFRDKFDDASVHTIKSFDCRKSIPILNKEGFCVVPHSMHSNYRDLTKCTQYCLENKTMLRYFDLREIVRFVDYVHETNLVEEGYSVDAYFNGNISEITMNRLKEYYLDLLLHIKDGADRWTEIYNGCKLRQKEKYGQSITKSYSMTRDSGSSGGQDLRRTSSVGGPLPPKSAAASKGILLTTTDAHTLTDGPTIFLAEDVNKIGHFYIQQSNIAASVFQNILMKITKNAELIQKIESLEADIEAKESKAVGAEDSTKTAARESGRLSNESQKMMDEINKMRKEIKLVSLDAMYVPNTRPHQQIWTADGQVNEASFVSNIGEDVAKEIMQLNLENYLKVLLLLGIGLFTDIKCVEYREIMKKLADEQRLFMIIASTDYIYGTNYQFCHGFIGKDLTRMTQQKTLQAMGRIGRNNVQQDYTIRFRDDEMIEQLFRKSENNLEAKNMCALFSS